MYFPMIYILDAAALLNNESFRFEEGDRYYTTSGVLSEWRDVRSRILAQSGIAQGALIITDPCPVSIEITMEKAEQSGTRLGGNDISLIALAAEFHSRREKFIVLTDDYSVQNVLKKIGVEFRGVMHRKIKGHRSFKGQE